MAKRGSGSEMLFTFGCDAVKDTDHHCKYLNVSTLCTITDSHVEINKTTLRNVCTEMKEKIEHKDARGLILWETFFFFNSANRAHKFSIV